MKTARIKWISTKDDLPDGPSTVLISTSLGVFGDHFEGLRVWLGYFDTDLDGSMLRGAKFTASIASPIGLISPRPQSQIKNQKSKIECPSPAHSFSRSAPKADATASIASPSARAHATPPAAAGPNTASIKELENDKRFTHAKRFRYRERGPKRFACQARPRFSWKRAPRSATPA